jgi:hypothetical protein
MAGSFSQALEMQRHAGKREDGGDADGLMVSAVWLQDAPSVAVAEGWMDGWMDGFYFARRH